MAQLNFVNPENPTEVFNIDERNEISRGGEGRIMNIDGYGSKVAKIYLDEGRELPTSRITEFLNLPAQLFLRPLKRLKGSKFNGFVMDKLDISKYFPLDSLFSPAFAAKRGLPSFYKAKVAAEIINGVQYAHNNNIVIGDLNQFNIMVNDTVNVKFIDVDSYETPSIKHNGKLLENIRDYYFGGQVCKESDYFALAIIIFNLLTGIHPYKGNHSTYGNNLKERMINNLSILSSAASDIKIPKFYQPLSNANVIDMFKDIFDLNKRYLISLNGKVISNVVSSTNVVSSDKLVLTTVLELQGTQILNVVCSKNYICVETTDAILIYNTPNKGIVTNLYKTFNKTNIILSDKYVYSFKDGILEFFNTSSKRFVQISNIQLRPSDIYLVKQYENILVIITKDDKIFKIYLNEMFSNTVKFTVQTVYSESFKKVEGLYQNIGVNSLIYYNNGKDLNFVTVDGSKIKDVIQKDNVGIMTLVNAGKIEYQLFRIDKYEKLKFSQLVEKYPFTANDKFIILLVDDKLSFIDKDTLQEVVSFEINIQGNYNLLTTNAGLVLSNNNKVLIINSK